MKTQMQKYTPGTWTIDGNYIIHKEEKKEIVIAEIYTRYSYAPRNSNELIPSIEQAKANGHLIASSLELLTVLKMIIEYDETTPIHKSYTPETYKPLTNLLREKAKQAIAQAEGG